MNVKVDPDLASAINDIVKLNGITVQGYVNNLIELGLYRDLEINHTENSVRVFMADLMTNKSANWDLLVDD